VFPGRERKKSEPLHGNAPKKESLSAQITAMEKFLFRGIPGGWVAAGLAGLFFFVFFSLPVPVAVKKKAPQF
jgi:hypothetical protein